MEKTINCPICKSKKTKFYFTKNNCDIYTCHDCNLSFVYPIPEDLNKIYSEDYFKKGEEENFGYTDYDKDKEPMRETFIAYLKIIEKYGSKGKILDIGAATGFFLDIAKNYNWDTFGTEISKHALEEAKKRGHKMFLSDFSDMPDHLNFEAITMWDVLEHLNDPLADLKKINQLLNANGTIIINTVDKGSLWAKIWGKKWHLIVPPEHLFYYSDKNLQLLLQKAGFKIIKTQKIGKKFSLTYIFKTLHGWLGWKIFDKLSIYFEKPFWRRFFIPINLRDNVFIIAKKDKNL